MKKVLAVFLAALLLLSVIPMTSFAKVENDDKIMEDILYGDFSHVDYVKENKYFKTEIGLYTALSLYDNAWDNFFTGSVNTDYAKTILLALIDRFEAEYNNETFEKILSSLKAAKTVADLVEKVDGFTEVLNLASTSGWTTSLGVLNGVIKAANFANDVYEEYVEAYAVILSCQAASNYYGEFLQYLADNCTDKNIVKAAKELKENITTSLEEARDELIKQLTEDAAKEGAGIGIEIAMDAYSVTAIIKTVYNTIGSLSDKLFNTSDRYQYMESLVMVSEIEEILPAYVKNALGGEDEMNAAFALSALITMRETGEGMLLNLGKVKEDSVDVKLTKNTAEAERLKKSGAEGCAKLDVYRRLINDEVPYKAYDVFVSSETRKVATVKNAAGDTIATVRYTKVDVIDETGAYISTYNSDIAAYIKVIVTFSEGCTVSYTTTSSTGGSSSKPAGNSFMAIFENFFKAISDLFKNLFKFR